MIGFMAQNQSDYWRVPVWLISILAEVYRKKKAAKRKRYHEKLMADPVRKAGFRAKFNAWRQQHRAIHGSYPTQEHLDKASAMQRRLYHERYKHDPEYKAKAKERRAKFQATEHSKEYQRNWHAERRAKDPAYKLYGVLCSRVSDLLGRRRNRKGTVELLGCSITEFMAHIEKHWEPTMNWENYGKGDGKWSLDHVRPCASFNLLDPEQVKQCFHFSNLRPSFDNSKKKAFWEGKHWFRDEHPRYSPEICACPPASEVGQSPA